MNDLFVTRIELVRDSVPSFRKYPFNIPIVKNFEDVRFNKNVTFLIGENGVGKSSFIEAIAENMGLNKEGGSQNFNFVTKDTSSNLSSYLRVSKFRKPRTKFFLRAESFYNFATDVDRIAEDDLMIYYSYGNKSLHEASHGESFMQLIENRFYDHGFYILDEPEAALSPNRQLELLCLIHKLAMNGSQFIIATHSPILIAYQYGEILDLNHNFDTIQYEDTEIYKTYKAFLANPYKMQDIMFEE